MTTGRSSSKAQWLLLFIASLLLFVSFSLSPICHGSSFDDKYDHLFKANARAYLPQYEWEWLKAQAIQESSLNPAAVSHAGAVGLMQIMPYTGRDLAKQTGVSGSLFDPALSIMFGSRYMQQMIYIWRARDRTPLEKLPWAQSSYNCGAGCVIRAQEKANDARDWQDAAPFMPKETRDYPALIRKHYERLILQPHGLEELQHSKQPKSTSNVRLILFEDNLCGQL